LHAGTLPARACVLTFDDGLRNNLDVAAPVLRALGLPASFYVVTDLVGTGEILWADRAWLAFMRTAQRTVDASDLGLGTLGLGGPAARVRAARAALKVLKSLPSERKDLRLAELLARLGADPEPEPGCFALMDWDEVGRLAADPSFEVGAHGASHEILSRLPHDRVEHETRGAHEHLAREIGRAPTTFAYPNGRPQDHDARAHAALERAGVRYALTTEARRARPADAWWAVPRLDVNSGLPWLRFRMLVEGTLGVLRRMRR
jgi:peptidoglycan/xylan/chitin deacetylase (PgdA/CDA1 family)